MTAADSRKGNELDTAGIRPWALMITFSLAAAMCASAAFTLILQQKAEIDLIAYQQDYLLLKQQAENWKQQAEKWRQQTQSLFGQLKGMHKEHKDTAWLRAQWHRDMETSARQPYTEITGEPAFQQPARYGTIPEKTVWVYFYHPHTCASSQNCVLNPKRQLLYDSIIHNKGSFHVELVHKDQVEEFISDLELPFRWRELAPNLQQGAVINALLARYGGVALDLCTCLLRPLDDYWNEMVASGASFRGYVFRLNGKPWRRAEAVADWFLMGRREGIFSSAVRSQVMMMGDGTNPGSYGAWRDAFGDSVLFPILSMFNYSLPRCGDDSTVAHHDRCPEAGQVAWWTGVSGPARNDTRLLLRDPRDGPWLPFALLGMDEWNVTGATMPTHDPNSFSWQPVSGAAMFGVSCQTQKDCWEEYVMRPFQEKPRPRHAPVLSFVKLNQCDETETKSREGLLAAKDSYFYNLLRLSGIATTM